MGLKIGETGPFSLALKKTCSNADLWLEEKNVR